MPSTREESAPTRWDWLRVAVAPSLWLATVIGLPAVYGRLIVQVSKGEEDRAIGLKGFVYRWILGLGFLFAFSLVTVALQAAVMLAIPSFSPCWLLPASFLVVFVASFVALVVLLVHTAPEGNRRDATVRVFRWLGPLGTLRTVFLVLVSIYGLLLPYIALSGAASAPSLPWLVVWVAAYAFMAVLCTSVVLSVVRHLTLLLKRPG